MEIIPAIDIRGGRCVRLTQGDYARETVFDDDPEAAARRWQDAGAARIHVVDLNGAREGRAVNTDAVRAVLAAVNVPVQLGGGIRDTAAVQRWLDSGVDRVVMGTAAVKDQTTLLNALAIFRERVAVAVDARDGVVVSEGWLESSGVAATALVRQLVEMGASRVIYTDTLRDGTLTGPNFAAIESLLEEAGGLPAPVRVIYSGGVSTLEDVRRLASLPLEGVIVGRALYTGEIDLAAALALVSSRGGP